MSWLTKITGIDALVEAAVERKIERVQKVSAAILGEEFVPKVIECDRGRHYYKKWEHMPSEGMHWTDSSVNQVKVVVRRHDVFRRECRACGWVERRIRKMDVRKGTVEVDDE